jgi:hypothetical protein
MLASRISYQTAVTYFRLEYRFNRRLDIRFVYLGFGELFVPVGRQPYLGQRALLAQDEMGVVHRVRESKRKPRCIRQAGPNSFSR